MSDAVVSPGVARHRRAATTVLVLLSMLLAGCQIDGVLPDAASCLPGRVADGPEDFPRFPGDGAQSVALPDGRVIWLLGDTILSDGKFVRNSAYVQRDACFTPLLGPGRSEWVPSAGDRWYWPTDAVVEGATLRVYAAEYRRTGPAGFDFASVDVDAAIYSLPDLRLLRVEETPSTGAPAYGMAAEGRYVYGTRPVPAHLGHDVFVARTGAPWTYWDGRGWNRDPASAVAVIEGVDAAGSVDRDSGQWRFVTKAHSIMGRDLVAYTSDRPQGPWRRQVLMTVPEPRPGLFSYTAAVHPEQQLADGSLLISWNLNAPTGVPAEYGPHFATTPRR